MNKRSQVILLTAIAVVLVLVQQNAGLFSTLRSLISPVQKIEKAVEKAEQTVKDAEEKVDEALEMTDEKLQAGENALESITGPESPLRMKKQANPPTTP